MSTKKAAISVIICGAILLIGAFSAMAKPEQGVILKRFAIIVGSNDGGQRRALLRYAHSDAESFAGILNELGGLARENTILLLEPDRNDIEAAFFRLAKRIGKTKRQNARFEVIFYYSGHSDEVGILPAGEHYSYKEIRESIEAMPAEVRIAVLDSCASGAFTIAKGGVRRAPFMLDSSVEVRGYAFLTSASADESAQESDRLGGSFFTHFLVSGMRGAADASRDGTVSLNEAYHYAFNETLARTTMTRGGAQHPNYDIQLAGSGDLVLTDLRGTSAQLQFSDNLDGRFFIRDMRNKLIAEINKRAGSPMIISLDPGQYEITYQRPLEVRRGLINITRNKPTELKLAELAPVQTEVALARGGNGDSESTENEVEVRPFSIALIPSLSTNSDAKIPVENNVSINLVYDSAEYLTGIEISGVGSSRTADVTGVQASVGFNETGGNLSGIQASAVANVVAGDMLGIQGAYVFNYVGRGSLLFLGDSSENNSSSLTGIQASNIANITRGQLTGVQGTGIVNYSGSLIGLQASGITNLAYGDLYGAQISGIYGYADSVTGAQISGILGMTTGEAYGAQLSGIMNYSESVSGYSGASIVNVSIDTVYGAQSSLANYAGEVTGAQFGLANYAGEVDGGQIGLINVTPEIDGLQIGLVNVALEMDGAPIGLINVIGNGMLSPAVWFSDAPLISVGLKMGSRNFFSMVGWGHNRQQGEVWSSLFWGFGGHLDYSRFWFDFDLVSHHIHDTEYADSSFKDVVSKLRLTAGFRINRSVSIFFGPTLNLLRADYHDEPGSKFNFRERWDNGRITRLYPGAVFGITIEPPIWNMNRF
jgi:Caspase domain